MIEAAKKKISTLKESLSTAKETNQRLVDESSQAEDDMNRMQEKYKKLYKNVGVLKVGLGYVFMEVQLQIRFDFMHAGAFSNIIINCSLVKTTFSLPILSRVSG